MLSLPRIGHIAILLVISATLFMPFLGSVHLFDWDEINFAECAREMIVTGDYSHVQIDFQPFWEKPPLFIWMQAISMKIFGVNEFAARFPNAICGMVTLLVVYLIGSRIYDRKFGLFWAISFGGSLLPFLYFKSGIIDPWFNLFIFAGVYQAILHTNNPAGKQGRTSAILSAVFIGLATLTKGPVAVLIFGLCALVYWVRKRFSAVTSFRYLLLFAAVFLLTAGSWFMYEIASGNLELVKEFFEYQVRLFNTKDAGHGGFFGYHFVVLFFGCFPASVFAIRALKRTGGDTPFQQHVKKWMSNLFWVVLILFSIVETKIVHYSSLCYFPLTFLSAHTLYKLNTGEIQWKKWMSVALLFIVIVLGAVFIFVPLIDFFKDLLLPKINDAFAADCLRTDVKWSGYEWIPGLAFLFIASGTISMAIRRKFRMLPLLFISTAITLFFVMVFITPKIEAYSQGPTIEFYRNLPQEKRYVETAFFKSYAQLFYTDKRPEANTPDLKKYVFGRIESDTRTKQPVYSFQLYASNYMSNMDIDRPAYIVVKSDRAAEFAGYYPQFHELYRKGGYVFFKREAGKFVSR